MNQGRRSERARRGRALLALGALVIASAAIGEAAGAAADFSAYKGWQVASLRIEGLDGALAKELRRGLALSGRSRLFRTEFPLFYSETLTEDVERARLFLARHGYADSRIVASCVPAAGERRIAVGLTIQAGARSRIASLELDGFPPGIAGVERRSLRLENDAPFSDAAVESASTHLRKALREAGHAGARIEAAVQRLDSTRVAVRFRAEPGPVYRFGKVEVIGAGEGQGGLVQRSVGIRRGQIYQPSRIERGRESLRLLGLYRRIQFRSVESAGDTLDLVIELIERSPRTVETGVGYLTDDLLRAHARWEHRNLFGAGRGLEASGALSRFTQTAGLAASWPAPFGGGTQAGARVEIESQTEESYQLTALRLGLSTRSRTPTRVYQAGIDLANVTLEVKTDEVEAFAEEGGLVTVIWVGLQADGSDDRLNPRRGAVTGVSARVTPPEPFTEAQFVSTDASASVYTNPLAGLVVAARLRLGMAAPFGASRDLLPNERFFAGGATSMRGFKRRHLGPLDESGAPLGGEALVESGCEARVPLIGRVWGALFVDAGQVWRTREAVTPADLEVAIGAGLMVTTPIGPVRADLGRRVTDHQAEQPRSVFHLSIGHPY